MLTADVVVQGAGDPSLEQRGNQVDTGQLQGQFRRAVAGDYYNSNMDGHIYVQEIGPGQWANLDPILKNNNASQKLKGCPP